MKSGDHHSSQAPSQSGTIYPLILGMIHLLDVSVLTASLCAYIRLKEALNSIDFDVESGSLLWELPNSQAFDPLVKGKARNGFFFGRSLALLPH